MTQPHRQNAAGSPIVGLAGGKLKKTGYMEPRPEEAPADEPAVGPASHQLVHGDALELLKGVPDRSVDLVLCDLPYDVTDQAWDKLLPMDLLWAQWLRVLRPRSAVVLTATNPFAAHLISTAPRSFPFRYEWVWVKNGPTNFVNAKKMPMRKHELVLVFYGKERSPYNPQGLVRCSNAGVKPYRAGDTAADLDRRTLDGTNGLRADGRVKKKDLAGGNLVADGLHRTGMSRPNKDGSLNGASWLNADGTPNGRVVKNSKSTMSSVNLDGSQKTGMSHGNPKIEQYYIQEWTNYPVDVLEFPRDHQLKHRLHPTQKPAALFEYLIRTYTGEGATVLDCCAGSFTTTVAAMRSGRSSVCMEMNQKFYDRGVARSEAELRGEMENSATNGKKQAARKEREEGKNYQRPLF